jgi:hypothetical protein
MDMLSRQDKHSTQHPEHINGLVLPVLQKCLLSVSVAVVAEVPFIQVSILDVAAEVVASDGKIV